MQSLQSAGAAGERVFEFLEATELEEENGKQKELPNCRGEVVFNHVKFGYEDSDKPMLILDEATSSVYTRTEQQIQRAMDQLMENRTAFMQSFTTVSLMCRKRLKTILCLIEYGYR